LTIYPFPIIFVIMAGINKLTRREFLKNSIFGAGAVVMQPWLKWDYLETEWPDAEKFGRNCTGGWINLRSRPSANSDKLDVLYEDSIVVWLREVIGEPASMTRRWIETPNGYVYAPGVQPVYNKPNQPLPELPMTSMGQGMWAEVTVPYVDIYIANPPARSPWVQENDRPRLYYSQVIWVDDIRTNTQGQVLYRLTERHGSYGDVFWAAAEAFRPIAEGDVSAIHPDAEEKRIVVNLDYQTLSCYEGRDEVYFCRISSGAKFDAQGNVVDNWATPLGAHLPWRKVISIHMSGGSTGAGWDTMAVPWTILFDGSGAAVHSTHWHNDFGTPRSQGCVNAAPEDAKWIYRWAAPDIDLYPGDLTMYGPQGTIVEVVGTLRS
jgi:lipoprotein-anchoring transpeptidase ErfK/SrfK